LKTRSAGTKRSVNARPTTRDPSPIGRALRIQTLRRPFFSSTVVSVAVETPIRTSTTSRHGGRSSLTGTSLTR
jgi:hypothetical protein